MVDQPAGAAPFDPRSASTRADPYPAYRALRERCPVHFNAGLDEFVVARVGDVDPILGDPLTFSNERAQAFNPMASMPVLPTADDPAHAAQRRLVARAFTPGAVNRLVPYIEATAHAIVDGFIGQGRCNLIEAFAYPLPMHVLGTLFGVPDGDADFRKWANDLFLVSSDPENAMEAAMSAFLEFAEFIGGRASERKSALARGEAVPDDLMTALVSPGENGEVLTDAEFIVAAAQLLVAGHESTTNLIGNAVFHLLEHPDQLARLRDDPSLVDSAIEEVLRFDSPVQGAWRRATKDVTVAGCPIPAESRIYLLFASANRDPDLHANPDAFDIARFTQKGRHFSFGHGLHVCLGASLARREGRIALQVLFDRLKGLALDRTREPVRSQCHFLRGFRDLPVRWEI